MLLAQIKPLIIPPVQSQKHDNQAREKCLEFRDQIYKKAKRFWNNIQLLKMRLTIILSS